MTVSSVSPAPPVCAPTVRPGRPRRSPRWATRPALEAGSPDGAGLVLFGPPPAGPVPRAPAEHRGVGPPRAARPERPPGARPSRGRQSPRGRYSPVRPLAAHPRGEGTSGRSPPDDAPHAPPETTKPPSAHTEEGFISLLRGRAEAATSPRPPRPPRDATCRACSLRYLPHLPPMTLNSTRRFFARPSSLVLSAMGRSSPKPLASSLFWAIPCLIRYLRTDFARLSERLRL